MSEGRYSIKSTGKDGDRTLPGPNCTFDGKYKDTRKKFPSMSVYIVPKI